jgi:hypothetical protein
MEVAFLNIKIQVEIRETTNRDALAKQKELKWKNPLPQKPSNPRVYATILNLRTPANGMSCIQRQRPLLHSLTD